jgi:hypothetical protein
MNTMPLPSRAGAVWAAPGAGAEQIGETSRQPLVQRAFRRRGTDAAGPDDPAEQRRLDRDDDEAIGRGVVPEVAHVLVHGGRDRPGRRSAADRSCRELGMPSALRALRRGYERAPLP